MSRRTTWVGVISLLFIFAVARFAYDFDQLGSHSNDFISPWVSAKVFLEGRNPYTDIAEFIKLWPAKQSMSADNYAAQNYIPYNMVYPPSSLPVLAPFTLLPWTLSLYVYLGISLVLYIIFIILLSEQLQLPWTSLRKLYLVAFSLAMAPVHGSIHTCNPNTMVVALSGIGMLLLTRRQYISGIALAIAMCIKPQVAFLFFVYPWIRRKWNVALASITACFVICASSFLWMSFHHVSWLKAYLATIGAYVNSASNSSAVTRVTVLSFYGNGSVKYLMTNLQVLIFQFVPNPRLANILSWGGFLTLFGFVIVFVMRKGPETNVDTQLALISVLTLLPIYQNFYTATTLVFVAYWAVRHWPLRRSKLALAFMLPLLLPLVALVLNSQRIAEFVECNRFSSHFLWNAVVMPHVIWIELSLVSILLFDLYNSDFRVEKNGLVPPGCTSLPQSTAN